MSALVAYGAVKVSLTDPTLQCCGSGMLIPDPDFCPSRIPDLGSKNSNKREGWKKLVLIPLFAAINFKKFKIILFLKCWRKKLGPIFKELLNFLPQKLSPSYQKYGFGIRDPRSGIQKKPIPYPGSRGSKRHQIPDPDPQHCYIVPVLRIPNPDTDWIWIPLGLWIRTWIRDPDSVENGLWENLKKQKLPCFERKSRRLQDPDLVKRMKPDPD